ncbi:MAG: ribosome maturation factor RimP [Sedimenticola sp.]
MAGAADSLTEMIRDTVEPMGYELVGVDYLGQGGGGSLLRIYIDHQNGITVDDCAGVSRQVSSLLDVENPIREKYNLEVSSPGLDRPLFSDKDFERFAGSRVNIRLRTKLYEKRRFQGVLQGILDGDVVVAVDDQEYRLPLEQIDKARLVPEL